MRKDRRTDKLDEANSRLLQFCERPNKEQNKTERLSCVLRNEIRSLLGTNQRLCCLDALQVSAKCVRSSVMLHLFNSN
jgi:hypothetical protein